MSDLEEDLRAASAFLSTKRSSSVFTDSLDDLSSRCLLIIIIPYINATEFLLLLGAQICDRTCHKTAQIHIGHTCCFCFLACCFGWLTWFFGQRICIFGWSSLVLVGTVLDLGWQPLCLYSVEFKMVICTTTFASIWYFRFFLVMVVNHYCWWWLYWLWCSAESQSIYISFPNLRFGIWVVLEEVDHWQNTITWVECPVLARDNQHWASVFFFGSNALRFILSSKSNIKAFFWDWSFHLFSFLNPICFSKICQKCQIISNIRPSLPLPDNFQQSSGFLLKIIWIQFGNALNKNQCCHLMH